MGRTRGALKRTTNKQKRGPLSFRSKQQKCELESLALANADSLRQLLRVTVFSTKSTISPDDLERETGGPGRGKDFSVTYSSESSIRAPHRQRPGSSHGSGGSFLLLPSCQCCLMKLWYYAFLVKCPPWKVISATINVMDAGDTTAFYIKLNCFHFSAAVSCILAGLWSPCLARIFPPKVNHSCEESLGGKLCSVAISCWFALSPPQLSF